jgi:hypothetical protein
MVFFWLVENEKDFAPPPPKELEVEEDEDHWYIPIAQDYGTNPKSYFQFNSLISCFLSYMFCCRFRSKSFLVKLINKLQWFSFD